MLTGYVYRPSPIPVSRQRLLDILNEVTAGGLYASAGFLSITEVTMRNPEQIETAAQFDCINKDNILFVKEADDNQAGEHGSKGGHRPSTAAEKVPVKVKLYMPSYSLIGQMYCVKGQRLSDLLNTIDQFLPMTDVEVVSTLRNSRFAADFIALNKAQIVHVHEV